MGFYDIKKLFRKLSEGTISDKELTYLNEWMASNKEDGLSEVMDKDWSTFNQTEDLEQAPRWMTETGEGKKSKKLLISWSRQWTVAASIALVLSLVALFALNTNQSPKFVLETNAEHRKQLIKLPDGSKVWLKQNSSLSYWKPFKGKERVFELEGEAFFDVVTDSTRPFIVRSDYLKTKVLGTSFNIISGKDGTVPEVALVEGAVEVSYTKAKGSTKPVILRPGKKVQINTTSNEIIASSFVEDAPYAWKDDVLFFEKANAIEVARTLEDWYDVEFKLEVDSAYFGALVHRYDTKKLKLEEVLKGISSVMPYQFKRQENGSYIIRPK